MAKTVLKDAVVTINGTSISDHCSSASVETTYDEVDFTTFTASNFREFGQGMGDGTINLTVFQDYAANSIDAIFWPLAQSGGTFEVVVRSSSAAVGPTNPKWTMTGRLFTYNPMAGAVGDALATDIPIRNAGTAGIVRGTS